MDKNNIKNENAKILDVFDDITDYNLAFKRRTSRYATTPQKISSNRSWAYTGENFISPTASKICPLHNPTTTGKGTDHGLTPILIIYTKI